MRSLAALLRGEVKENKLNRRQATRQRLGNLAKPRAALLEVRELIERCTSGREQHDRLRDIRGFRVARGMRHGLLQRLADLVRDVAESLGKLFRRLADLMELGEDNPFKIRAYRVAAETIEDTTTPLAAMIWEGGVARLRELPGIGEAISKKVIELLETGTFKAYEDVKAKIPETTLDLLKVEGVGLKTLQLLYQRFQIANLDDFAKFVEGGGLASVPHLGAKTHERIRASLKELLNRQ